MYIEWYLVVLYTDCKLVFLQLAEILYAYSSIMHLCKVPTTYYTGGSCHKLYSLTGCDTLDVCTLNMHTFHLHYTILMYSRLLQQYMYRHTVPYLVHHTLYIHHTGELHKSMVLL